MKNVKLTYAILLGFILLAGCSGKSSLVKFIREGGLETKGLVNLALASNGTRFIVSKANPDHPAHTLNNGITSSENWDQGEGWESKYEGRFSRGGYVYREDDPRLDEMRRSGDAQDFDPDDPAWRGLRAQTTWGGGISTALGWVIIEFPEQKMVNRVVIHTIDSAEYPAAKFGVSDVQLQYWTHVVDSWKVVERFGKGKGQAGNSIRNSKSRVITFRFQPVKTSKLRLIIRWTNDSRQYNRGNYTYSSGTIRLLEIEAYGYEKDEQAEAEAEVVAASVIQDANEIAEIEIIVDNYVDGYNRQKTDMLMSSISPDYSKDEEKYPDLKKRMESVFEGYEHTGLELKNLEIELTDGGAKATSTYTAQYEGAADGSPPVTASGILIFRLSDATGQWKITRIDSQ